MDTRPRRTAAAEGDKEKEGKHQSQKPWNLIVFHSNSPCKNFYYINPGRFIFSERPIIDVLQRMCQRS
jgi:hypothetical protein